MPFDRGTATCRVCILPQALPKDVVQRFADKIRISTEFEAFYTVRLEMIHFPDPLHGGRTHTLRMCNHPHRPVRGILWFCIPSGRDNADFLLRADPSRTSVRRLSWRMPPSPSFWGSVAEFVGRNAVENAATWKSPKTGLSLSAWKSRNRGGIPTFEAEFLHSLGALCVAGDRFSRRYTRSSGN